MLRRINAKVTTTFFDASNMGPYIVVANDPSWATLNYSWLCLYWLKSYVYPKTDRHILFHLPMKL